MEGTLRDIVETHSHEPSGYMTKWLKMTGMGYDPCTGLMTLRGLKDKRKHRKGKQTSQIKVVMYRQSLYPPNLLW
jgi:hypothetical protein